MPFKVRDTLEQMESHLRTKGYITHVTIGEPSSPPATNGITAAIYMESAFIDSLTLSNTIEEVNISIRLYQAFGTRDIEGRDDELEKAAVELETAFLGDVDLGATIRDIRPVQVVASFGYLEHSGVNYRIVDYIVPFLLDGNATLVS